MKSKLTFGIIGCIGLIFTLMFFLPFINYFLPIGFRGFPKALFSRFLYTFTLIFFILGMHALLEVTRKNLFLKASIYLACFRIIIYIIFVVLYIQSGNLRLPKTLIFVGSLSSILQLLFLGIYFIQNRIDLFHNFSLTIGIFFIISLSFYVIFQSMFNSYNKMLFELVGVPSLYISHISHSVGLLLTAAVFKKIMTERVT